MMATGRPCSTCAGVNCDPAKSSRFISRKYVVSTPTSLPVRRRPSRVISVLSTTSELAASTSGTASRIAMTSRSVTPGQNFFGFLSPSSFAFSSFCSTIGVIITLFEPSSFICARISDSAPFPIASIAITEATPKRMPSEVSDARSLLWPTASTAVRMENVTCAVNAPRSSARRSRSNFTSALLECGRRGFGRRRRLHGNRLRGRLRVITGLRLRHVSRTGELFDFELVFVRWRREQHAIADAEPALDHDVVVVHGAKFDFLLHDARAALLVHVRNTGLARDRLERYGEHVLDRERLDVVGRGHARAKRRVRLLDGHLHFEHLRVRVRTLLPHVRDCRDSAH